MSGSKRRGSVLKGFIGSAAGGGLVLMAAAAAALALANSPLSGLYFTTLHVRVGGLDVLHWINDGLMALFFLLVGLEIKREVVSGQLSTWPRRILPGFAAAGGMVAPALVYVALQQGQAETLRGWAIPAATDIAFALGVLSLLGSRVPVSLKIFLTALAIIDDLGAILIIALFYTAELHLLSLAGALAVVAVLAGLNRLKVVALAPYLLLGGLLWWLVLRSGLHATLAGVALAFTIPARETTPGHSPLLRLEHALQPWIAFGVTPVFGLANAGVSFAGMSFGALQSPAPLGVAAGLFLGKQAGVFGAAWLAVRLRLADLPAHASWRQLYGVCVLCGVGFTMSLFIGLLAFDAPGLQEAAKLGVLVGSGLSAVVGWAILAAAPKPAPSPAP